MTAAAIVRMYAALIGEVDGMRLISPERTARICAEAAHGVDRVFGRLMPKGLGYFFGLPEMGADRHAFGVKGSGGQHRLRRPHQRIHLRPHQEPADRANS